MDKFLVVWAAITAALLHSIEFDHWLPYVVTAKAKEWRTGFTLLMAFVGAIAHLISTTIFGLALILLGEGLIKNFESGVHWLIGGIVVAVGLIFVARGIHSLVSGKTHGEHCSHGERRFLAENHHDTLFLGALFGLRPCIEALPIMLAASKQGIAVSLFTIAGWALASVAGMIGVVWLGLKGLDRLKFKWLERYNEILTGLIIALIGLYALWG